MGFMCIFTQIHIFIMKFENPQCLHEIATLLNIPYKGNADFLITGLNEIHAVEHGDIVFVDHPKYYKKALESKASVVLIDKDDVEVPDGKALLISDNPFRDYNKLSKHFKPFEPLKNEISKSATIAEDVILQPGVIIGNHVQIGKGCVIHSNVTICDHSIIGERVVIQSNTVIGGDAFYYKKTKEGYQKMLSTGNVHLEDDVEIGCGCTIDRGVSATTLIGKGTKIDNLVHIGHDTLIGKHCLIASQVGISGCTIVEDEVTIWGQVGVNSSIRIGKGAVINGQSGVTKSIEGGKTYFGLPAIPAFKKAKELAMNRQIPKILEELKALKSQIST